MALAVCYVACGSSGGKALRCRCAGIVGRQLEVPGMVGPQGDGRVPAEHAVSMVIISSTDGETEAK